MTPHYILTCRAWPPDTRDSTRITASLVGAIVTSVCCVVLCWWRVDKLEGRCKVSVRIQLTVGELVGLWGGGGQVTEYREYKPRCYTDNLGLTKLCITDNRIDY